MSTDEQRQVQELRDAAGRVLSRFEVLDAVRDGVARHYDLAGKLMRLEHWRGDRLHGESLGFAPDGQLRQRLQYAAGMLDGAVEIYDTRGQLLSRTRMREGVLDGLSESWAEGELLAEIPFVMGRRHGTMRTYEDGQPLAIFEYVDDKLESRRRASEDGPEHAGAQPPREGAATAAAPLARGLGGSRADALDGSGRGRPLPVGARGELRAGGERRTRGVYGPAPTRRGSFSRMLESAFRTLLLRARELLRSI